MYSPSFDIEVNPSGGETYRVSYEGTDVSIDRDFTLTYRYIEEHVGVSVIGYKTSGTDGYFMMLLSPSWKIDSGDISAKEVLYIVDCSGSMRKDGKLDQVKDALLFGLQGLRREDRFNIISFSSEPRLWKEGLVSASKPNLRAAEDYIKELAARGGTNINDSLKQGLEMFSDRHIPRILVFLTDGQPTIGVTDPGTIVDNVLRLKQDSVRVFSFGVGHDVNTFLLDKLSEMQRGATTYVDPSEDLELKLSGFFEKIESPVLTDITVDFGDMRVFELFPVHIPDLFKGSQLTVVGRYRAGGGTEIELNGSMQGARKRFKYRVMFPGRDRDNDFVPHIWAARKIGFLLDEIRLHGETEELVDEVVRLAKKHGIPTPYTSYLVTEDEIPPVADTWPRPHHRLIPADRSGKPATDTDKKVQFETARMVQEMKNVGGLRSLPGAQEPSGAGDQEVLRDRIKRAGEKTFHNRQGYWIDTAFEETGDIVNIKFLSKAYFDLVNLDPLMAKYVIVGEKVKVSLNGLAIVIDDDGIEELTGELKKKISAAILK
jgi:Ca-activated chloride channel family protein